MWDHTADVTALMQDFHEEFFGPAAEPTAELAAGERCRLPCRLVSRGQRRAVMLLHAPELKRNVEPPPASEGEGS